MEKSLGVQVPPTTFLFVGFHPTYCLEVLLYMKKFVMLALFAALVLSINSVFAKTYTCSDDSGMIIGFNLTINIALITQLC